MGGGPAAGSRRHNVEARFREKTLYVRVFFWALKETEPLAAQSKQTLTTHAAHKLIQQCYSGGRDHKIDI